MCVKSTVRRAVEGLRDKNEDEWRVEDMCGKSTNGGSKTCEVTTLPREECPKTRGDSGADP